MTTGEDPSAKGDGLKVFGPLPQRRRSRPPSYWLRAGCLAFIGVLNLLAALGLLVSGVCLLATGKGEGGAVKAELRLGAFTVRSSEERADGSALAAQQRGRETLAVACLALSLVPFSIAVLAHMQYKMAREMAWLQPPPEDTGPQKK